MEKKGQGGTSGREGEGKERKKIKEKTQTAERENQSFHNSIYIHFKICMHLWVLYYYNHT
jgi:hypothetical protein